MVKVDKLAKTLASVLSFSTKKSPINPTINERTPTIIWTTVMACSGCQQLLALKKDRSAIHPGSQTQTPKVQFPFGPQKPFGPHRLDSHDILDLKLENYSRFSYKLFNCLWARLYFTSWLVAVVTQSYAKRKRLCWKQPWEEVLNTINAKSRRHFVYNDIFVCICFLALCMALCRPFYSGF